MSVLTAVFQLKTDAWAWRVYTPSGELYAAGMQLTFEEATAMAAQHCEEMLAAAERQGTGEAKPLTEHPTPWRVSHRPTLSDIHDANGMHVLT